MTNTLNELIGAIPATRFITNAAISAILSLIVLAATIIDMTDALITARRTQCPIHSHALRKTVAKITEYWRVLLAGFLADSVCCFTEYYDLPYTTIVMALGLVVIEIKSLIEHARLRKSAVKDLPEALGDALRIAAKMKNTGDAERIHTTTGNMLHEPASDNRPSTVNHREEH
ncbi:MAG: hypothetical protein K2M57_03370 [Paramuribaculum sp.]|nr:hypothetical protein [Paramuribaculum sp.]